MTDKSATVSLNFDGGAVSDLLFRTVSSSWSWIPLALLFLYLIFRETKGNWLRMVAIVVGLALTITLCDQVSSSVIKPLAMRLRPSHDLNVCYLLHYVGNYRGGLYGFVSSHAANAFGAVAYTAFFVRKKYFVVLSLTFAIIVSYSRIYLGVHFLGDVVAGAMIGLAIGSVVGVSLRLLYKFHANWFLERNVAKQV